MHLSKLGECFAFRPLSVRAHWQGWLLGRPQVAAQPCTFHLWCCPHMRGGWIGVMDNKTVWNWLGVPLKLRTELSYLDWKSEDKTPMVGGHTVPPNRHLCPAWGAPDDSVNSFVSRVTTHVLWNCTPVCTLTTTALPQPWTVFKSASTYWPELCWAWIDA